MTRPPAHPTRRRLLGLTALGLTGLGVESIAARFAGRRAVRRSAVAFGTVVSITLVDDRVGEIEPAFANAFAAIRSIEHAANLFDPNSEISRLNRDSHFERPSTELSDLVEFSLRLADQSGGAFDPTVQPVWLAWKAARDRGMRPSESDLARAVTLVDYRALRLDERGVWFAKPGMGLTLNALAQGLAADRVMAAVTARGIRHAFIDTGELGAQGTRPDDTPWRVGVAHPRDANRTVAGIALAPGRFVATSADKRCAWTKELAEHHIVEPWSGHSPRELAEVSVVASSGLIADGLSTAAMVLGRARSAEILALDPGASAIFVDKSGRSTTVGSELAAT